MTVSTIKSCTLHKHVKKQRPFLSKCVFLDTLQNYRMLAELRIVLYLKYMYLNIASRLFSLFFVSLKLKITKAIFPSIFRPAYDYTCTQVSELCAQCRRVFKEHGLEEDNETIALENRLNKDVLVYFISKTQDCSELNKMVESIPKRFKDFYKTIIEKNKTSECFAGSDVANEVLAHDKDESLIVFLTDSRNRDILDEILDSELSKNLMPRLFIICYEMENLSCLTKKPNKDQDRSMGYVVKESTFAEVPNLIDNLCEKYIFAIVESKAKTLHGVYNKFYGQPKVGDVYLESLMNICKEEQTRKL